MASTNWGQEVQRITRELADAQALAARTKLRDEFAMAALPAYIAHGGTPERAARDAYVMADAMLEARNANR